MTEKTISSETLTVMFIDIAGYTSTSARASRQNISDLQDLFDSISIPTFLKYHGNVVKKIGDAFLITFKSPTNAILCGIELQKEFIKNKLKVRIGLHTGEVIIKDNDIYGDTVNTASRLQSIAKPGHIIFSGTVYLVVNKNEIPSVHLGQKKLKGIPQPVRIFRVKNKYDEILKRRMQKMQTVNKVKRKITGFVIMLIMLGLLAIVAGAIIYYLINYSNLF